MSYWWVNQGQTYEEERSGGYLWSPKLARNGSRRPYYDAMMEVAVDDIIFHYQSKPTGSVRSLSLVTSPAVSAEQPPELRHTGLWDDDGWLVEVRHVDRIRQVARDEAMALGVGERPFTSTGRVNQGYLYALSERFGTALLELADPGEDLLPQHGAGLIRETAVTVPLEEGAALEFEQIISPDRRQATRAEWTLVDHFVAATGISRTRRRYTLTGGISIYCDLFVESPPVLIEAKASAGRSAVREGIGQLHDYAHKEPTPVHKVLLLPEAPASDLLEVCRQVGILVVWDGSPAWNRAAEDLGGWLEALSHE